MRAGGQGHLPFARLDHTTVFHLGAEQRHDAVVMYRDLAVVAYQALELDIELAAFGERLELLVGDHAGAGDQGVGGNPRVGAKPDAGRVQQDQFAVGGQHAVDVRRVAASDPVEGDRTAIGLLDVHLVVRADGKFLPVDACARGAGINAQAAAVLGNAGRPGNHFALLWQGIDGCCAQGKGRCTERHDNRQAQVFERELRP
ncbi:hypothetical protein D9M71_200370 [compost metagenome]